MTKEIKIVFSKEKFNIFSHVLGVICSQKEVQWQEDQIGIKFSNDGFFIEEIDRGQSLMISARFPKSSIENSKLDDFFIMLDVDNFLNSLNFCNLIQDKYETIDITFKKDRIIFLGQKKGQYDFRPNANAEPAQLPEIQLPIKIENVDIEDFRKSIFLVKAADKDNLGGSLNPIKISVENNHVFIESTEDFNMFHGEIELICNKITPKNIHAELLMSDYGLKFINKLAEKAKKMDFYFKEEGVFKANVQYEFGSIIDVFIARRSV